MTLRDLDQLEAAIISNSDCLVRLRILQAKTANYQARVYLDEAQRMAELIRDRLNDALNDLLRVLK